MVPQVMSSCSEAAGREAAEGVGRASTKEKPETLGVEECGLWSVWNKERMWRRRQQSWARYKDLLRKPRSFGEHKEKTRANSQGVPAIAAPILLLLGLLPPVAPLLTLSAPVLLKLSKLAPFSNFSNLVA